MATTGKKLGSPAPQDRRDPTGRTAGEDRTAARAAARALSLHEAHPHGGRPPRQPLPAGQGGGRPLLQSRPGGDRRRQRLRPRAAGRDGAADPQPGLDARPRRPAARGHDAVHGQERQPHRRQGRQHPLRRPQARPGGADLDARRGDPGDGRRRPRRQDAGEEPGGPDLHRRRRHLDGRLPRGAEPRRGAQRAVRADRREQRLGLLDADRQADADQEHRRPRRRLRHPRRDRRRQRRARRLRGHPAGRRAGARRRRADADRIQDLPHEGARRARRRRLRAQGAVRGVEAEGSDRALRAPSARQRPRRPRTI